MFDPPVEVLCRGGWIARDTCDVIADTKLSIAGVQEIATRQDRSEVMLEFWKKAWGGQHGR
jgi:hypothetical protein